VQQYLCYIALAQWLLLRIFGRNKMMSGHERTLTVRISFFCLGRDTGIDTFIEGTSRWMDGKFLFILFEKINIILCQSRDIINFMDGSVWTMTSNLPRGGREHTPKLLVITLYVCGTEEGTTKRNVSMRVGK